MRIPSPLPARVLVVLAAWFFCTAAPSPVSAASAPAAAVPFTPASPGVPGLGVTALECGKVGQRPCTILERIPSCDPHLVEDFINNVCFDPGAAANCGKEGQRPCTIAERIPSCDKNLIEDFINNVCFHPSCGRENDRACTPLDRLFQPCDTGYTEIPGCSGNCSGASGSTSSGTCIRATACGGAGQRACTYLERGFKPCDAGLKEVPGCSGDCFSYLDSGGFASPNMCSAVPATMADPTTDADPIPPDTVATGLEAAPPPGTVWGYADLHMHLLAHLAHGGGVLAGTPYAYDWETGTDLGFMKALAPDYGTDLALVTGGGFVGASDTGTPKGAASCPALVPNCGSRLFHGDHTAFDDPVGSGIGTNDGAKSFFGAPVFSGWPLWTSTTHQQVYYKWLERAWQGGLRLISQLAVSNEALCRGGARVLGQNCLNSMQAIDAQLDEVENFEKFVDLKNGGPGKGWFRIVKSPREARDVMAAGKMAVVLGIEVDNLFGARFAKEACAATGEKGDFLTGVCNFPDSGNTTYVSLQSIKDDVDRYYERGVRHIFPVHNFDNTYGAPATWQDAIEVGNRISEGHWWATSNCPTDDAGQKYGFVLGSFTQLMVSTIKFWLPGIITEYPARTTTTPQCNFFGLFPAGEKAIEYMMQKGMIVDVDHMSRKAFNRTIQIAMDTGKPVVASHVLSFDRYEESQRHERMRTKEQLQAIRNTGGMIAAMLKDDNQDQSIPPIGTRGEKKTVGYGAVADNCRHSSRTFAQAYEYAVDIMGGPVAFGSDFNGVAGHIGPRFGNQACGGVPNLSLDDRSAQYRSGTRLGYPFLLNGFKFEMQKTGEKTFDYNVDGMAHAGLLPDFVADLEKVGLPAEDRNLMFRSGEAFIRVWEKASGIAPGSDGPQGVKVGGINVWPDTVYDDKDIFFSPTSVFPATGSGGTSVSWNFGDNTPVVSGAIVTHKFANPGTYTVTVTATDSVFGATATASRQITVADGNSTFGGSEISIDAPSSTPEGSTVKVKFIRSILWATKSVNCGQGVASNLHSVGVLGNEYEFNCFFPGGINGTQDIAVTANQVSLFGQETNVNTVKKGIQVVNVAPKISLPAASFTVPFTASPTTFSLPIGLIDTGGDKINLQVTWSDGTPVQVFPDLNPGTVTTTKTFTQPRPLGQFYTVTIVASDEVSHDRKTVTVDVVAPPPNVFLTGPDRARVGETAQYIAKGSTPGLEVVESSCGPAGEQVGTTVLVGSVNGIDSFMVSCRFLQANPANAVSITMVRVVDARTNSASKNTRVGTPPDILLDGPRTVDEGTSPGNYFVQGYPTDGDNVTVGAITCGAANPAAQSGDTLGNLNLHVNFTCAFANGPATVPITAIVRDLDGDTATSIDITVRNVRPSIAGFSGPAKVKRNEAADFLLQAADPGADTLTATINWGDGTSSTLTLAKSAAGAYQANPSHQWTKAGLKTVSVTLTDGESDPVEKTLQIQIGDNVPPVVTVPAAITAEATGSAGAAVEFTATAQDNLEGALAPSCSPASGSTFPLGTTTVTCKASDSDENEGSESFTIKVVDTTKPSVTVPGDMLLEATGPAGAPATFSASASDAVSGTPATTCDPISGSTFALGTTTVTCTATDGAGNSASAAFKVTVRDTTAPVIATVVPSITSLWPANHKMVAVAIKPTASDIVDASVVCKVSRVTSNEAIVGLGDGDTAPDWLVTGALTVDLRAERSGKGSGRIYTVIIDCADAAGNTTSGQTTVAVPHSQKK